MTGDILDLQFKLLLYTILFISTFSFDIIGVGVSFCHSDNTIIRKIERRHRQKGEVLEIMEVY